MQAARLKHFHPLGHPHDALDQRVIEMTLERRFDLDAIADLLRKIRRDLRQRFQLLASAGRPRERPSGAVSKTPWRCIRCGSLSMPPQPQVGARRITRDDARDRGEPDGGAQSAEDGSAERSRRDLGERPGAHRHASAPRAHIGRRWQSGQRGRHTPQRRSGRRPGTRRAPDTAMASSASGTSIAPAIRARPRRRGCEAARGKLMPNALTKQTAASALVSARSAPASGKVDPREPRHELKPEQQRLEREPFTGEAIQRGETRDRERADQKEQTRSRASG